MQRVPSAGKENNNNNKKHRRPREEAEKLSYDFEERLLLFIVVDVIIKCIIVCLTMLSLEM